jgi:hypothetical protein
MTPGFSLASRRRPTGARDENALRTAQSQMATIVAMSQSGGAVTIATEPDPPPIVRIMATTLRRSARDPKLRTVLAGMTGVAALRSTTDAQAATMRFSGGGVHVERGVADDVDVVLAVDLATMNDPDPPKPKVSGAARHLRFALALAKVLEPPRRTWQQEATSFFEFVTADPTVAPAMTFVDTTTGRRLELGSGERRVELHASPHVLGNVLSGNAIVGEEAFADRLRFVGTLRELARLTGRSLEYVLNGAAQ